MNVRRMAMACQMSILALKQPRMLAGKVERNICFGYLTRPARVPGSGVSSQTKAAIRLDQACLDSVPVYIAIERLQQVRYECHVSNMPRVTKCAEWRRCFFVQGLKKIPAIHIDRLFWSISGKADASDPRSQAQPFHV